MSIYKEMFSILPWLMQMHFLHGKVGVLFMKKARL